MHLSRNQYKLLISSPKRNILPGKHPSLVVKSDSRHLAQDDKRKGYAKLPAHADPERQILGLKTQEWLVIPFLYTTNVPCKDYFRDSKGVGSFILAKCTCLSLIEENCTSLSATIITSYHNALAQDQHCTHKNI